MKRNALSEIKELDIKALKIRVTDSKKALGELRLDKNMSKLKDLKSVRKLRVDIAQMLTVLKQKESLVELEKKGAK